MKPIAALACFAALLCAAPAVAQETTGRVRAVYFEAAPGVLVDASMLRRRSATRWLDVELENDLPAARRHELVLLPRGMEAVPGDRVALRLGESRSTQLAEVLPAVATSRALAVIREPKFAESASTGASSVPTR